MADVTKRFLSISALRALVVVAGALLCGCSVGAPVLRVSTWNVENLFDGVSDGGEYPEFDPARSDWSARDYQRRLDTLGPALELLARETDLLVVTELENPRVASDLMVAALPATRLRFTAAVDDPDAATCTALYSRWPIVAARRHRSGSAPRLILELRVESPYGPLALFLVHAKSRRAATTAEAGGSEIRAQEFRTLALAMDRASGQGLIPIAAGDFNAPFAEIVAVQPGLRGMSAEPGTYRFRGEWMQLDHVLLWGPAGEISAEAVRALPFADDAGNPSGAGHGYAGLSDHLPLRAVISFPGEALPH